MIVYNNNFEWDIREASACRTRYGVSFKEATTVLDGASVTITEDPASGGYRAVGPTSRGQVLVVLFKRGPRTRILDACPPKAEKKAPPSEPAAPEKAAEPAHTEPAHESEQRISGEPSAPANTAPPAAPAEAARPSSPAPRARSASKRAPATARPEAPSAPPAELGPEPQESARVPVSAPPASDSPPAAAGWDAATYEIYWNVYSAVRKSAREQGKSLREAQRLGKEAGERAVRDAATAPPSERAEGPDSAPRSSRRESSWRAAARAVK